MGLIESVSAIVKCPEVSCGDSVLMSQMASTWSNHVEEVLGMSWFRMAFLTSVIIVVRDDPVHLPFLRGPLYRGLRRVARPLDGAKGVSEHALRLLVPFARCSKWDAAGRRAFVAALNETPLETQEPGNGPASTEAQHPQTLGRGDSGRCLPS